MTTVYFDTNVFRHLTADEETILRKAIDAKQISILLSAVNLEELLAAMEKSAEDEVFPRIRRLLRLVDRSRFLKDTNMLLRDDLVSYAECGRATSPVLSGEDLLTASARVETLLLNKAEENREARLSMIQEAKHQKESFLHRMMNRRAEMWRDTEQIRGISFEFVWENQCVRFAENYARRVGVLDACNRRGINGLLKLKSVRMAIGIALSYFHAKALQKQPQEVDIGDSRDLQHAILAAARADVFATREKRLRTWAARVPIAQFRVLAFDDYLMELRKPTVASADEALADRGSPRAVRSI
jgi:predicted nucleic acid-binding protein